MLKFSKSYWQTKLHTFPNIKQYWHFQRVTGSQYYALFQTTNNTDIFRELLTNNTTHFAKHQKILTFSESYWQTILNTFPNIKKYWHLQGVTGKAILHTLPNIKQYWQFQRVTGKQYYILFQNLYQPMLTLPENSFQIKL